MRHNIENRCLRKLQVEDRVLECDPNERRVLELDEDEQRCHFECNGYNRNCQGYEPVRLSLIQEPKISEYDGSDLQVVKGWYF